MTLADESPFGFLAQSKRAEPVEIRHHNSTECLLTLLKTTSIPCFYTWSDKTTQCAGALNKLLRTPDLPSGAYENVNADRFRGIQQIRWESDPRRRQGKLQRQIFWTWRVQNAIADTNKTQEAISFSRESRLWARLSLLWIPLGPGYF